MKRLISAMPIPAPNFLIRGLFSAYIAAAGFSPLMAAAYDPGCVPYGRIGDRTPVVTNAWEAVSNKTHSLIEKVAPVPGAYAIVSNAAMNAISRFEAGLSRWRITPSCTREWHVQFEGANELHTGGWRLFIGGDDYGFYEASESEIRLDYADYTVTRAFLPTMDDLNALTSDVQKFACMDGTSNGRRFKEAFGKQGSQYRGSGFRYIDQYYYGGLFGMDYGAFDDMQESHFSLWSVGLFDDDYETNVYFSVYRQLPTSVPDYSRHGVDPYVYSPGFLLPGEYGQIPWFSLKRAVDAYGRVGSLFSRSESGFFHTWDASEDAVIQQHHPTVAYVISAVSWVTNFVAKHAMVHKADSANKLVDRGGISLDANELYDHAAQLTSTSTVPVYAYSAWSTDWPDDDPAQPTQPVWTNGAWAVWVVDRSMKDGPFTVQGSEADTNLNYSLYGYETRFWRVKSYGGTTNIYGLARLSDVPRIVTNETAVSYTYGEWDCQWHVSENEFEYMAWSNGVWYLHYSYDYNGQHYDDDIYTANGAEDATTVYFPEVATLTRERFPVMRNALGLARLSDIASATNDLHKSLAPTNALQGHTFDFSTQYGLYSAVSNLVILFGGSITNFPALP